MAYLDRIDSYKEEMLKALSESVSKPSVKGDAVRTEDGELLPFGRGVHEALVHMLGLGASMGFDTLNGDNTSGHIEWKCGEKDSAYFGIIGHLDVVPEGTGWSTDPFEMTDKGDGFVYGRGVADDKGPVIAALYAMKALKDEGLVPKMDIRLVFGLDEETGVISANHYTENFGQPEMGFTPDGNFPLVNGEMGNMVFDLAQKFGNRPAKDELRLTRLEGGTAHNAVPADAKAVIAGSKEQFDIIIERAGQYSEETGYSVKTRKQGSSLVVETTGVAAHGAHPHLGLNAVSIMMEFLGRISFANEELNEFIAFYNDHIGFALHGEKIGCEFEDDPSGPLIFNVGIANINEEIAMVKVNIRYPVTCTHDQVMEALESSIEGSSIGIVSRSHQIPVYIVPDDPLALSLMEAYRTETGDADAQPETMGGGTYAKQFNRVLAFGGMFPGEEDTMHQADEKLSKESFIKMSRIFARALYSLCFE